MINTCSVIKNGSTDSTINLKDLDMSEKYRSKIEQLVLKHKNLFASKDSEQGHTDVVKMTIDTGDIKLIKLRPYRTPIKNREVIDKAVDEMLDAEVIRR